MKIAIAALSLTILLPPHWSIAKGSSPTQSSELKVLKGFEKSENEPYRQISDEKAVELAIKAIKKDKIFGGAMVDYSETEVQELGTVLRVTFIRHLPPNVLGSEKMFSVELDAHTGRYIGFLGY
jgi:hypothetical protein